MSIRSRQGSVAGFSLVGALLLGAGAVRAAPSDYRFEVADVGKSSVKIRIIHKPTSKAIGDAIAPGATALVGPSGKPNTLTTRVQPVFDPKAGVYIVRTEVGVVIRQVRLAVLPADERAPVNGTIGKGDRPLSVGDTNEDQQGQNGQDN